MIRPCLSRLSNAVRTVFDGIAKPIPCEPPVVEAIAVLIPITSPRRLISGPPLFPGLIAALVWIKSPKKSVRFGRPFELMIPSRASKSDSIQYMGTVKKIHGRWLIDSFATTWSAPRLVRWYSVE